jgi:alpha-mannosidase
MPAQASFITVDADNVIVESVKQAEEGSDVIVRMYEAHGSQARTGVHFGWNIGKVSEVNLLERGKDSLKVKNQRVNLKFAPFEIKTLRLVKG